MYAGNFQCGSAHRFPRGEAVIKIGTIFMTEEEYGQKCYGIYNRSGIFLTLRFRRSSSVSPLGCHLPPGGRYVASPLIHVVQLNWARSKVMTV